MHHGDVAKWEGWCCKHFTERVRFAPSPDTPAFLVGTRACFVNKSQWVRSPSPAMESWANRKPAVLKTAEPVQAGVRVQVHGLSATTNSPPSSPRGFDVTLAYRRAMASARVELPQAAPMSVAAGRSIGLSGRASRVSPAKRFEPAVAQLRNALICRCAPYPRRYLHTPINGCGS
jgi:hypothetical protein